MAIERGDLASFSIRRYAVYPADWIADGKTVRIQSFTERERSAIEAAIQKGSEDSQAKHSYRSLMIAVALVDDEGRRIFMDSDEHLSMLDNLDAMVTSRLIAMIDDHCQMGESAEARNERQEIAEKNSHAILAGAS